MKTKVLITILLLQGYYILFAQISRSDVDKIAYEEMIRQELPGLVVGVYQKGKIDYTQGYGHIDIDRTKKITDKTPLRWASISKTLTAVATFQLEENNNDFGFTDKVVKHFPYWITPYKYNQPTIVRPIPNINWKKNNTIRQLLRHESGIKQYGSKVWSYKKKYKSDKDNFNAHSAVDAFKFNSLDSKPGSKYKYTTQGYVLLGAIIDKYTGSYTKYIKKNITDKLGMTSLKVSKGKKYGFQKEIDGIINTATYGDTEWVLPGGGWESNVIDLLKFAKGIMNNSLLKNTSRLWRSDENQKYQGLQSTGNGDDLRVWHGGAHPNLRTLMYIMPKKKIAVVVMIPAEYADTWNIVRRIVDKMGVKRNFKQTPKDKCTDDMGSSKKKIVGVWLKTGNDVLIRRGYNTSNFNKEWKFLMEHGYRVFDIETYKHKGKLVWDGIFKKAGSGYGMYRNFDYDGFYKKWQEMRKKGFRQYDLEGYTDSNNKKKWAGLFKKATGSNGIYRNLSTDDFGKKRIEMAKQGKKLIDIEVSVSNGEPKWSGLWISGEDGLLNRNYDSNAFYDLNERRMKKGYKLIDIEVYKINGKVKWAGIWEKNSKDSKYKRLSYCDFMKTHQEYSSKGYELIDIENY